MIRTVKVEFGVGEEEEEREDKEEEEREAGFSGHWRGLAGRRVVVLGGRN